MTFGKRRSENCNSGKGGGGKGQKSICAIKDVFQCCSYRVLNIPITRSIFYLHCVTKILDKR